MLITQVEAKNFRNYNQILVRSLSPINIFFGDNGQGKTSFLEAIYLALRGQSFKPYTKSSFIKEEHSSAYVEIHIKETEGVSKVKACFTKTNVGFKKDILYCNKQVSTSFLYQKIPLFIFTEQSLKVIRKSPQDRRDFIDQILLSRGEGDLLKKFHKVLKEKNSLLQNYKKELIPQSEFQYMLKAINEIFIKTSLELTQKRIQLLKQMFQDIQDMRCFFNLPELKFQYKIHKKTFNLKAIKEVLLEDLKNKLAFEIQSGMSLSGPHKHDIVFLYKGQDSRVYCSQGQQRILVLSLLGTQLYKGKKKLLFLDDVLMELDDKIQEKFLSFLQQIPCQSFLTNCKKIQLKSKKMSFFNVKNGTIDHL